MIPSQFRIDIDISQLGFRGISPVLEIQIYHAPGFGRCRIRGRVDMPDIIVANDGRIFDGHDFVRFVGDRLDQDIRGLPLQRRRKQLLRSLCARRRVIRQDDRGAAGQQNRDDYMGKDAFIHMLSFQKKLRLTLSSEGCDPKLLPNQLIGFPQSIHFCIHVSSSA